MKLFQNIFNKLQDETIIENIEKNCIYSPIEGEIISLQDIQDGVFSEGILGKGCGLKPSEGKVYAPFDGKVIAIAATKHAMGLKNCDGIELLIHVGMDTVKMNGQGFNPLVKVGDKVRCGQSLMTFSLSDIQNAGYVATTAIVVINSEEYANVEVLKQGIGKKSEKIILVS